MESKNSEIIALNALAWLVADDDLRPVFLGATGLSEAGLSQETLRQGAADPAFLGSVLDFILMDDAWVIRACDAIKLPYEDLALARHALPGGTQMNWT